MKNDNLIAIKIPYKLIGFNFSLSKDDGPILRIVALDESKYSLISFAFFNHQGVVLDSH